MKKEPDWSGIEDLGLSARANNALRRKGIHYKEQLDIMDDKDLLRIKGVGKGSLAEIRSKIGPPEKPKMKLAERLEIEQVLKMVAEEFDKAVKLEYVRNPIAYALYKVWKFAEGITG